MPKPMQTLSKKKHVRQKSANNAVPNTHVPSINWSRQLIRFVIGHNLLVLSVNTEGNVVNYASSQGLQERNILVANSWPKYVSTSDHIIPKQKNWWKITYHNDVCVVVTHGYKTLTILLGVLGSRDPGALLHKLVLFLDDPNLWDLFEGSGVKEKTHTVEMSTISFHSSFYRDFGELV